MSPANGPVHGKSVCAPIKADPFILEDEAIVGRRLKAESVAVQAKVHVCGNAAGFLGPHEEMHIGAARLVDHALEAPVNHCPK
jgi:hypothetical protein